MSKQLYEPALVARWRERAQRFALSEIELEKTKTKTKQPARAASFRNADKKTRAIKSRRP